MTADLFRLDGSTAFVSGAAGHLGRVMALALAGAGAHVVLNGRDPEPLAAFAEELRRAGISCECAAFDVTDTARVRDFFARRERIDVLVNNAVTMAPKPFAALTPEDFTTTYASSVSAAFEVVRAALPGLRRAATIAGEARIVNIASMYALISPDKRIYAKPEQASPFHYGPAKAALLQLTRHLAAEFGRENIRVNALVPGPFPKRQIMTDDPSFAGRLADRTMLGRLGAADEIAGPLLFLATKASSYVTGACIAVDGGWTAW
ncbi:MAG: SDR family oxidoreductase [Alphaproteobacteria bacterium]|nr:SDR family oxidoreductase [Alphaproteobacteria bacterium]